HTPLKRACLPVPALSHTHGIIIATGKKSQAPEKRNLNEFKTKRGGVVAGPFWEIVSGRYRSSFIVS
ncbi:MAG: hypothetical protein IJP30_00005, partial [Clostridia bacterium]|nr:hypothetical protein [Clostridia bacterium]